MLRRHTREKHGEVDVVLYFFVIRYTLLVNYITADHNVSLDQLLAFFLHFSKQNLSELPLALPLL